MTARFDGASSSFGFSTRPVIFTTPGSSVASTAAAPYRWMWSGSTSMRATIAAPVCSCSASIVVSSGSRSSIRSSPSMTDERVVADVRASRAAPRGRGPSARPGGRSGCRRGRSSARHAWRAARDRPCPSACSSSSGTESKWFDDVVLVAPDDDQDVVDAGLQRPLPRRTGWPACRRPAASPSASPWWREGSACRVRRRE